MAKFDSINFSTRQKIGKESYARVIPFGRNYIVKRKGSWGIVDKNNHLLLPIEYSSVHWFDGQYAGVLKDKRWGLVNSDGTITIEPQYEVLIYDADHQACEVEIDSQGDRFVVDVYNNVIMRVPGKTVRFSGDKFMVCSKGEWQLVNMDGTPFSNVHSLISSEYEGYYNAYDDCERTLIKSDGSEVKLPAFEIGVFADGITQFRFHDKYGIIDDNGNIVVPNQYDYIYLSSGVIAINEGNISKDKDYWFYATPRVGKWFFWNYDFQEITPYKYDEMGSEYCKEGLAWFGKRNGVWYRITPGGESLFAENDSEYKSKKNALGRGRERMPGWGKFRILEDTRFQGEGRKLFVRSCDGFYIRKYYFTPYLPDTDIKWHYKIGEYFVNKYGQGMFNPHAFKMPKQKKRRSGNLG